MNDIFQQFRARFALCLALIVSACAGTAPQTDAVTTRTTTAPTQTYAYAGGVILRQNTNGQCQLTLKGTVESSTLRRLTAALNDVEGQRCTSKRLVLDAADGILGDAITIGSMLKNRGYDTALQPGSTCNTSCLLVFAAGKEREIPNAPATRLAFTQIPPDQDFGRNQCDTELSRGQTLTLTRYLRAMLSNPVATAVYQKLLAARCDKTDVYGPSEALAMGLATRH